MGVPPRSGIVYLQRSVISYAEIDRSARHASFPIYTAWNKTAIAIAVHALTLHPVPWDGQNACYPLCFAARSTSSAKSRLVPVPISTLGGWHPDAYVVIAEIARGVAVRAVERRG